MARRWEAEVPSFRRFGGLALASLWLLTGVASAQEAETIPIKVLVTHVSNDDSGVEPDGRGLLGHLRKNQISVDSVKVISKQRIVLRPDQVHAIPLPNGRKARIQAISRREKSALMAVDVEGSVKVDARVRRNKPFIIRAGRHDGGNLIIQLQLDG